MFVKQPPPSPPKSTHLETDARNGPVGNSGDADYELEIDHVRAATEDRLLVAG